MGDAMDEEKERRQQLAGVRAAPPAAALSSAPALAAAAHCSRQGLSSFMYCPPICQVRKEAREAIARERDQQIAMMIARWGLRGRRLAGALLIMCLLSLSMCLSGSGSPHFRPLA